ncbi:MAG: 16S rRNA (guanine(527)-N(7))-methyltransferase RsmG [Candidatus Kryptoniota bacterium]
MIKDISWFISICAENGLKFSNDQAGSFEKYRELLLSWNSRVNLISRKDEHNFYPHHALNCISFLFNKKLQLKAKILDLGTGGGLPGVPMKILYEDLEITMLDSIAKKNAALADIVNRMQLTNTEVVTGRAEELAKSYAFRGKFDYVISRAAGKLDEVVKWSRGFLKEPEALSGNTIPQGSLIILKGGIIDDELKKARKIGFVDSILIENIVFTGMDELENKDKKLVLVKYDRTMMERKN